MQTHIESAALTEGLNHSLDRYHWARLVRQLKENLDKLHVAKSKFHVKCSSLWTMEDEFGPNQEVRSLLTSFCSESILKCSELLVKCPDCACIWHEMCSATLAITSSNISWGPQYYVL